MKTITKLDDSSAFSGVHKKNNEIYLRPISAVDENGNQRDLKDRCYVFRLLGFSDDNGLRTYPFIVRYEHQHFIYDANGKCTSMLRIVCNTSEFVRSSYPEVSRDCPICKYSMDRTRDMWRDRKHPDRVAGDLARDSKKIWAVYIPVYVINDPTYEGNNKHAKVLRLSGDEGKKTYERLVAMINEQLATKDAAGNPKKSVNVFNGGSGVDLLMLCDKVSRVMTNKKTGAPVIDPATGKERTYMQNAVVDMRFLTKRMREYPAINEEMFRSLDFDNIYATPATDEELQSYMHANYVDIDDDDFEDEDDFGENLPAEEEPLPVITTTVSDLTKDDEDIGFDGDAESSKTDKYVAEAFGETEDEDDDESVENAIQSVLGKPKKTVTPTPTITKKVSVDIPKNTETLREQTTDVIDLDELPF